MRNSRFLVILFLTLITGDSAADELQSRGETTRPGAIDKTTVRLPNNWLLSPIGQQIGIGDLPLGITLHPGGRYVAITNAGYRPDYISIVDLELHQEVQQAPVPHCWNGVAFAPNGRELAVSVTSRNSIRFYSFEEGRIKLKDTIALGPQEITEKIYPTGLAYTPDGESLVVANILGGTLALIDVSSRTVRKTIGVDAYPTEVKIHPSGKEAYVSTRGGNSVQVVRLPDLEVEATIKAGSRPNHMALTPDGRRLFVACANSGDVQVIDTEKRAVSRRIDLRPYRGAPAGTTPNNLAVTKDGRRLYVANADNNDVAVVDVQANPPVVLGRLPVGWYPTLVALTDDDRKLLVANGKGLTSRANPQGPQPTDRRGRRGTHVAGLFPGTLSVIDLPEIDRPALRRFTETVKRNNGWERAQAALKRGAATADPVVVPRRVGEPSLIKYVLYILKENRTYDQVFGDMREGDGDPELCLFPEKVTPNHHKLARTWVLFDNFYTDAEVSMDGHLWSMGGIAVDYIEKTWPSRYSGQGRFYARGPGDALWDILYEDVAHPDEGYIWDAARRAGLSVRSYWEMDEVASLAGYLAPDDFIGDYFNRDYRKAMHYIEELREYEKNGNFPRLQVMSLGNDHTQGTRPGRPTPQACVGDNDRGLGLIIEALSQSKFWPEMAVFVVEDDAQNGPDHIDAHRTVALVASPYARRGTVDHTQYSTVSILKTIELILGLPPMTQYDAAAIPMLNAFTDKADLTPYRAEAPQIDLNAPNPEDAPGAQASIAMNLDELDDLTIEEEQLLNEAIWKSVKGADSRMPAPVYWATKWSLGK